jgi:cytosine/adenosine deaminase-related metal-dependent hydrolase
MASEKCVLDASLSIVACGNRGHILLPTTRVAHRQHCASQCPGLHDERGVVIRNDTIVYVGDAAGSAALIGDATDVRDLDGQLVLPGFIDTHAHPVAGGGYATALSLETWGTVDDWVEALNITQDTPDPVPG